MDKQLSVDFTLQENLKNFVGQYVQVMLASGDSISGNLKNMSEHLLHLEKIDTGRWHENANNLDALVKLTNIIGIQVQVRGFKGNVK